MIRKLKDNLKNNKIIIYLYDYFQQLQGKILFSLFPKWAIKRLFKKRLGYQLNLENPKTFNEKIQWIKFYWRDERITKCIDKFTVRNYVEQKGLKSILNNLIGVYENVESIDINKLPNKFVLKTTHGSGWNILCFDKNKLNWPEEKRKLKRWLNLNFYYFYGEWGYKNIKPRILCEEFIETSDGKPPKDYKVFCFNGTPQFLFVASDRIDHQTKFDFYSCEWEWLPVNNHYPNNGDVLLKPESLPQILEIARKLSDGWSQVRVDLYVENERIIFGELTFYHFSGIQPFVPFEYDKLFGEYFQLPQLDNSQKSFE